MRLFAVQSAEKGSGKTTTLRVLANICPRPDKSSSYTAATVWRSIAADHPTLFLDEANTILKDDTKADLVAVLNCGDLRDDAWIKRSVPTPKGGWRVERVNVFGAVALAGIKELTETLQDRSIRFALKKVPGTKVREHLRDGKAPELLVLRRKLAAWAASLRELPDDPKMPPILLRQAGRVGDNWRPLFAIAELAGGRWPKLIEQAALSELFGETEPSVLDRLLRAIHKLFEEEKVTQATLQDELESNGQDYDPEKLPDNHLRLQSTTIVDRLIDDGAEEWGRIYERREITPVWLGRQLRGLLKPPGAQDWWIGAKGDQKHYSGYWREQFYEVWETHPRATLAVEPGGLGGLGVRAENPSETAKKGTPSGLGAPGATPGRSGIPDRSDRSDRSNRSARSETPNNPDLPGVRKDEVIQGAAARTPGSPYTPGSTAWSPENNLPAAPSAEPAEPSSPSLAEKLAEKLGSAPRAPNGPAADPPGEPETRRPMRSDTIRNAVLAHAREHPEWSAKDISKVVPRAVSVIQRILDAARGAAAPEGTA